MVGASDSCAASEGERADVRLLAEIALFSSLDDATLMLLSKRLRVRTVATDELVFEEGQAGRAMFVVLGGRVSMFKRSAQGNETQVALAQRGDWFGEMALLDVMARAVSVRALEPTRLLVICPTDLEAVYRMNIKMYALLVMNVARQLSRKLRVAEHTLACALTRAADHDAEPS